MSRTATYNTTVRWTGDHWGHLVMGNGPEMKFSAPPDAHGHAGVLTPEDAFVAAANTCVMMMFVWATERFRLKLLSYECRTEGTQLIELDRTEVFTRLLFRPVIRIAAWGEPKDAIEARTRRALQGNETVFDLGAGSGYFSFKLAQAVPRGKVVAADLEPEMIRHIHHKAMSEGVTNLIPVIIKADDPQVPGESDLVFVCDVLHHVQDRAGWLKKAAPEMKPGARFVLVEFKEGKLPEGPPEAMKISRRQLIKLVSEAGLPLESEKADLLPYQVLSSTARKAL